MAPSFSDFRLVWCVTEARLHRGSFRLVRAKPWVLGRIGAVIRDWPSPVVGPTDICARVEDYVRNSRCHLSSRQDGGGRARDSFSSARLGGSHIYGSDSKRFRTINVQWIGQCAFLPLVAVPRINNLRVLNTLDSSTPAHTLNRAPSRCRGPTWKRPTKPVPR